MEEWLDDNKHLLGTIGMVILVVQVGGLVMNCSFRLHSSYFSPIYFPSLFFLSTLCLGAFVCVCLSGNELRKRVASAPLSAAEKLMRPALSGRSGHPRILKY